MIWTPSSPQFLAMVKAYKECLLWTMSGPDDDENPGDRFTLASFTRESRIVCDADCLEFLNRCRKLSPYFWAPDHYPDKTEYVLTGYGPAQFGHDLALSRNGHGAGFFDRDALRVPVSGQNGRLLGDILQDIARAMGERDVTFNGRWIYC